MIMQAIYKTIDKKFESFVENNRKIFKEMEYGEIAKICIEKQTVITLCKEKQVKEYRLSCTDMLEEPFNIAYLGKKEGFEGDYYIFLDKTMDKIYSYYDVE